MNGWNVAAAVPAFVQAAACGLGFLGLVATSDHHGDTPLPVVLGLIAAAGLVAVAMVVGGVLLLALDSRRLVLAAAVASLVVSVLFVTTAPDGTSAYEIPLAYAVLPALVLVALGAGARRRRYVADARFSAWNVSSSAPRRQ